MRNVSDGSDGHLARTDRADSIGVALDPSVYGGWEFGVVHDGHRPAPGCGDRPVDTASAGAQVSR